MKNFWLIIFLCSLNQLFGQEVVLLKDLYVDNFLFYKVSDNQLFSGNAQKIRKNGHLVYEEFIENGILKKSVSYYNRTEKPIPALITEYHANSFDRKKEIRYDLSHQWRESRFYDINKNKTLIEEYENDKLIYRCEYMNNKKHGTEFCYDKQGNEIKIQYKNGKKETTQ
jgi:antitoxin component YwqK of YwqJK toxin-antitoxin module